jgi:Ion transport protein
LIPGIPNFTAIRAIRVLRPLRSINTLQGIIDLLLLNIGMKHLVTCLLKSLPALGNVALFLFFLIILFSILGLQLFIDRVEARCRYIPAPVGGSWPADISISNLCGGSFQCPIKYLIFNSLNFSEHCGNPADYNLEQNWTEIGIPELVYGIPNYNNIFNATLTVFQSLTTEGWSTNMYMVSPSRLILL